MKVVDENNEQIAVQIPVNDFARLEEVIENYGLAKLMDDVRNDEVLNFHEAETFYHNLKNESV